MVFAGGFGVHFFCVHFFWAGFGFGSGGWKLMAFSSLVTEPVSRPDVRTV